MSGSSFTIRGGAHPHVLEVPGQWNAFTLGYEVQNANDIFSAMLKSRPYPVCEFSLANFLTLRAQGEKWLTALPIFPNRAFRHGTLYVRRQSDLLEPSQLRGARVGVEDYSMSAAVWVRGFLWDDYGVDHGSITWVTPSSQRFDPPPGATLEYDDRPLEELLADGAVDAIVGMHLKDSKLDESERRFRPLLADPRKTEAAYYRKTGIYPINHCVAIRSDVLDANPGLDEAVADAYVHAKASAYRKQGNPARPPWVGCATHPIFESVDRDPLEYGLTKSNRHVIETLTSYLERQGFAQGMPPIEDLFLSPAAVRLP
jgi:4,5-dihydroxyphthalate decarboxylase